MSHFTLTRVLEVLDENYAYDVDTEAEVRSDFDEANGEGEYDKLRAVLVTGNIRRSKDVPYRFLGDLLNKLLDCTKDGVTTYSVDDPRARTLGFCTTDGESHFIRLVDLKVAFVPVPAHDPQGATDDVETLVQSAKRLTEALEKLGWTREELREAIKTPSGRTKLFQNGEDWVSFNGEDDPWTPMSDEERAKNTADVKELQVIVWGDYTAEAVAHQEKERTAALNAVRYVLDVDIPRPASKYDKKPRVG